MVRIVLPNVLQAEADGQRVFDVDAETVGDALRALPISDLLLDEQGELRAWLNVYVDGTNARDRGGHECPLSDAGEVRILAHIAGG
jgi:molybdopterin converting factor small subunit